MSLLDVNVFKQGMYNEVQSLFSFYNGEKNTFNKHKNERSLKFVVQDRVDTKSSPPEINAYALYRDSEDIIYMTTELYNLISKLFSNLSPNPHKNCWMIHLASFFCIAHEFAHLYAGHNLICKNRQLCMLDPTNAGLDLLDYQTIEMDADATAASRVVEKMLGIIRNGEQIKSIWENNIENFYTDSFTAITGFFFLLRYLDSIKSTGEAHPLYGTHPPSIARYVYVVGAINEHGKKTFKEEFTYNFDAELLIKMEAVFVETMGIAKLNDYSFVTDESTFLSYTSILKKNWQTNVKHKLQGFNRIALAYN